MYPTAPNLVNHHAVNIAAWNEPTITDIGFDPRSPYAELFWLPILGPSTTWLLRNIAQRFDVEHDGFVLDIGETAAALGIGASSGKNSAFHRSMNRIVSFSMGYTVDDNTIAVRRLLPELHVGQLRRLTPALQRLHRRMIHDRSASRDEDQNRAAKVAMTLLRLGDSPDLVEQQLVVWGIEPRLARDAVNDAWAAKGRDGSLEAWAAHA